jgi:ABC-2 type transport system ATP-binding protein
MRKSLYLLKSAIANKFRGIMDAIRVEQISKFYDEFKAVDSVSFSIPKGRLFGLIGPNGAGKTTTMRMIMNIIIPDRGSIEILGEPFRGEIKDRIGYLPEERGLYPKMKLVAHLQFLGEMKSLNAGDAKKLSLEWLEKFDLGEWAEKKIQDLSKGMQQKVQFIGTIMHSPDILIVDEPFSGLDPVNTKFLKDVLLELKQNGTTIILSTHLMEQAEKLCENICLINHGRIVLQGALSEIKKQHGHNAVILEYNGDASFIQGLAEVAEVNNYPNYMEIRLEDNANTDRLFKEIAASSLTVTRFELAETSLNEIFIEMVGDQKNEKDN